MRRILLSGEGERAFVLSSWLEVAKWGGEIPLGHFGVDVRQPLLRWFSIMCHLPSGDGCSVELSRETTISELRAAAQQHFQRRLKLTANGRQLDLTATLSEAGLQDGDVVTAVVQLSKMAAAKRAKGVHSL